MRELKGVAGGAQEDGRRELLICYFIYCSLWFCFVLKSLPRSNEWLCGGPGGVSGVIRRFDFEGGEEREC